jgi:DNA-directed RNA polymerase specialized sigma24 family protein
MLYPGYLDIRGAALNRFRNVDWARLYKLLVIHAACALRRYKGPDSFDGEDCEDIADEVLKDFYESPDALGWKESKGKLETFLGRIAHNKLVDRLRRQKHVGNSLDDPNRPAPAQKHIAGAAPKERSRILKPFCTAWFGATRSWKTSLPPQS